MKRALAVLLAVTMVTQVGLMVSYALDGETAWVLVNAFAFVINAHTLTELRRRGA